MVCLARKARERRRRQTLPSVSLDSFGVSCSIMEGSTILGTLRSYFTSFTRTLWCACPTYSLRIIVASQPCCSMMNSSQRCTIRCSHVRPCLTKHARSGISIQIEMVQSLINYFPSFTGLAKRGPYSMSKTILRNVSLESSMASYVSMCHLRPIATSMTFRAGHSNPTTKTFGPSRASPIRRCFS